MALELKFDSELEYQQQAISSITDLFRGQTPMQSNFTVSAYAGQVGMHDSEHGIRNRFELSNEELLENLRDIQLRNGLPQSTSLGTRDFDVDMETGTGKTYVYLRSILELKQQYGFTKFIIVVPSLAIKEGVFHSLKITNSHFRELYNNEIYDYFIYDSSNLEQVRSFATSDHISIMVINIDAFRKSFTDPEKENKANIIHRANDTLNGMRPIELIQETNPILIIDEPQSVDTTARSKEAIKSLNPLCSFRYSATHVKKNNLVYKLDAIDAHNLKLVKQIEVTSLESKDNHNQAYMRLVSTKSNKAGIIARVELDVRQAKNINRKTVTVKQGDDFYDSSKGHNVYEDYLVQDIGTEKGNEYLTFTSKSDVLTIGDTKGDINNLEMKELQIVATIRAHLEKELVLTPQGIKVLSLFFIDRVANYRTYDDKGNPQKGVYAELFEKHYKLIIQEPKFNSLFKGVDIERDPENVHDGYFSQDRTGKRKGQFKDTSGATNDDQSAYELIMKDKEKLLSFDSKLKFIFSHSTLREGWDNPNVFQICTLNETKSEVKKRQEIGRGLRLAVNQQGERLHGFEINKLTVIANESYEKFCKDLQKEYEEDSGIRFGVIEKHTFANIMILDASGKAAPLGAMKSEELYDVFVDKQYISQTGEIQKKLQDAVAENRVVLPESLESIADDIIDKCKKAMQGLSIKNTKDRRVVSVNKQRFLSDEFKTLWEQIKYKTTFRVDFDSNRLIEECVKMISDSLKAPTSKIVQATATVGLGEGGVFTKETSRRAVQSISYSEILPDIIGVLQNQTSLTRKTIVEILRVSDTLHLFKKNPQVYMQEISNIINIVMRNFIVDGIKYTKLGDESFYAQELFEEKELIGYFNENMLESTKNIYDYVVYDSDIEKNFASRFETNDSVKVYAKLPNWFKIPTPLGSYNPDWAVLIEEDGKERLYLVVETKGTLDPLGNRPTESGKIVCGKKHFSALNTEVTFSPASSFEEFIENIYE